MRRRCSVGLAVLGVCAVAVSGCSGGDADVPAAGVGLVTASTEMDHSEMDHSQMPGMGDMAMPDVTEELSPECVDRLMATIMMYTPVAADELLAMDCAWPYLAVSVEGGVDDPSIVEPFAGRSYAPIWEVVGATGYGTCSVTVAPDPGRVGWVQGFVYEVTPTACLQRPGAVKVTVAEYATEALRDEALNASASAWSAAYGRGVIEIDGAADDIEALANGMTAMVEGSFDPAVAVTVPADTAPAPAPASTMPTPAPASTDPAPASSVAEVAG